MTAERQTARLETLANVSTFGAPAATGRGGNWGVWDGARLGVVMGRPGRHLLPAGGGIAGQRFFSGGLAGEPTCPASQIQAQAGMTGKMSIRLKKKCYWRG